MTTEHFKFDHSSPGFEMRRLIVEFPGEQPAVDSAAQGEAVLRQSRARFRALIEHVSDGIFIIDREGKFLEANSCVLDLLGWKPPELLSRRITDTVAAPERSRVAGELARVLGGQMHMAEWQFVRRDGSVFHGEVCLRMLPDGEVLGTVRNESQRKQTEQALRESEARTRALAENLPVGVFMASLDGQIIYTNPALHRQLGRKFGAMLGEVWAASASIHPGDREAMLRAWTDFCDRRVSFDQVARFVHADGAVRSLRSQVTAVWSEGKVVCYVGSTEDITERREAEEQMLAQLEELSQERDATSNPEARVQELQREVNELLRQAGCPVRYPNLPAVDNLPAGEEQVSRTCNGQMAG